MKGLYVNLSLPTLLLLLAGPLAAQDAVSGRPKSAIPGSTPERRAALQKMTAEQRQELLERSADPALRSAARQRFAPKPKPATHWVRSDLFGQSVRGLALASGTPVAAAAAGELPLTRSTLSPKTRSLAGVIYSGRDADEDSLPDEFEDAVADAFTPVYHVSGGEQPGTGFALFANSSPLAITQNLPAVPPVSYLRVTPVGFAYSTTGQQFGFLQIDYLTIWNRDDGLDVGGDCRFYASVLGGLVGFGFTELLDGSGSHEFDQERSATLVAAPTPAPFQYAADPDTYQAYDFYTAAHEGTFTDHSAYLGPSQPVPANNHLNLGFSRAKHGTYAFNPDGLPLVPDWVIFSTYFALDDLYYFGIIGPYEYVVYLGMADAFFYSCFVEHFQEQGGTFADPRINVGELGHPIKSAFIADPRVQSKLTPLLWQVQ